MNTPPLPTGCHDAKSAAELLNTSKRALLKKMRVMGWLHAGGDKHNQPRSSHLQRGWLTTQTRAYKTGNVLHQYQVMLLTQTGFMALQQQLNNQATTTMQQPNNAQGATDKTTRAPAQPKPGARQAETESAAPQTEREKAMQQLRDWGLAS